MLISWVRVVAPSEAERPASDPHWSKFIRPVARATQGVARVHYSLQDVGEGLKKNYDAERGGGVGGGCTRLVEHDAVCPFQGDGVGPVGHQGRKEFVDEVERHPINPFPHGVGGHVRPGGRRRGATSQDPGHLISRQHRAVAEGEEDGVKVPGWLASDEVIKERLVYLRRGRGIRQLRATGRQAAYSEPLCGPDSFRRGRGQQ